jgi:putative transposase
MSIKYKEQLYFTSFAVVNWNDLFVRNEYKDIMLDRWKLE